MKQKNTKYVIYLLIATVFWGLTFPLTKIAVNFADPFPFLAVRFSIAGVILLIIFHKHLKSQKLKFYISGAFLGLFLFISMYFQVEGIKYTTASNAAFLTAFYIVLVPICSCIIYKKRLLIGEIIGVLLATLGLTFVCGIININFAPFSIGFNMAPLNYGDLLTLISAFTFTIYILLTNHYSTKFNVIGLNTLQMLICGLCGFIAWSLSKNQKADFFDYRMIIATLICAVFASAIAYLLMLHSQKHIPPNKVVLILTAEPVLGAIFAMFISDIDGSVEMMSIGAIVGSVLILFGILGSELIKK